MNGNAAGTSARPSKVLVSAILAFWAIGFAIAVQAPSTVLTENAFAREFVSVVSRVTGITPARMYASTFPQVSALYYNVVWFSFPFWLVVIWNWGNSMIGVSTTGLLFKAKLSILDRLISLALVPFWLFLAYVGFALNHGGDVRSAALGSSRLQLATLGMGMPIAVAAVIVVSLLSLRRGLTPNRGKQ